MPTGRRQGGNIKTQVTNLLAICSSSNIVDKRSFSQDCCLTRQIGVNTNQWQYTQNTMHQGSQRRTRNNIHNTQIRDKYIISKVTLSTHCNISRGFYPLFKRTCCPYLNPPTCFPSLWIPTQIAFSQRQIFPAFHQCVPAPKPAA